MKKYFAFLFIITSILAQSLEIKSLQVYTINNNELPVVTQNEKLTIEFDIAASFEPNLVIKFYFCDKNWVPYENIFLENQSYNTAYNLWFDHVPVVSGNVRYHFKDQYPNIDVTFPFSGKWKFFVTESNDPDQVYAEGRFYVVNPQISIRHELKKYRLNSQIEPITELQRVYDLRVNFSIPDTSYPMDLDFVEIIENKKIDYPINIKKERRDNFRYYETNGARSFAFIASDIRPGNEYRQVNLRDRNKYQPPVTNAHFEGFDYDRFQQFGAPDFNGGFELVRYDDNYADYMQVEFEFSPQSIISDDLFLVGAFNDWTVLLEYKLEADGGIYRVSTELKRGIYDYQYVSGVIKGNEVHNIDWYNLEGNFWETTNNYYIFVYYKSQKYGGYDQIIGYLKINSGNL